MKKPQKNKNSDDNFKKTIARNWIIFFVALAAALFFYFIYPMIHEFLSNPPA
ncbi:MAG: hypothetical protein FWD34_07215 [Oscillospiraceae bacterium]|nr:hypothetical protein [Oscillospiraceae bacterium]